MCLWVMENAERCRKEGEVLLHKIALTAFRLCDLCQLWIHLYIRPMVVLQVLHFENIWSNQNVQLRGITYVMLSSIQNVEMAGRALLRFC